MLKRKYSAAEPVSALRYVPIRESGEVLVDFLALCPKLVLDRPRFHYRRETLLRKSVAEKLCVAANALPDGFMLAIIEGWRPPYIQRRMYRTVWEMFAKDHPEWSDTKLRRTVNRFTAPLDSRVPPPHTTGGAVDVVLADESGKMVDQNSPYDWLDPHGFPSDAPNLNPEARRHRDILAAALSSSGLTNYPSEYWHWSYGDQGWAYRGNYPNALYGPTQPPGWTPAPADDVDEALEFLIPVSDA